jgi:SAM-dependent methyltransferase
MGGDNELAEYWERAGGFGGDDRVRPVIYVEAPRWMSEAADAIQRRHLDRVLPFLVAHEPVVELGCGTGRWQGALRRAGARPFGVDRSSAMLAKARASGADRLVRADASRLPIRDGCAGAVLSVTVLQHMPPQAQEAALAESRRVAREGAVLCMLERIGRNGAWHVFPRMADGWIQAAERAGWHASSWSGVEYLPAVRALRSLASAGRGNDDAAKGTRELRPPRSGRLRDAYLGAVHAATVASLPIEPLAERILPKTTATHGLFLFRA